MIPLIVLLVATLIGRGVGLFAPSLDTWPEAIRLGLVVMFVFAGSTHFTSVRNDYIRMVPPVLSSPGLLVSLTGVLEILGGLALLTPLRPLAAIGLTLLLVALLPANVHAVQRGVTIAGRPSTPLRWRVPMQVLYRLGVMDRQLLMN